MKGTAILRTARVQSGAGDGHAGGLRALVTAYDKVISESHQPSRSTESLRCSI